MAEQKLVGTNYTTPDIVAKVTGRAKYAEDFRADGMLFCKLLLSPMPHARVINIDTSEALAMPGVKAILTADDLPKPAADDSALTNEPAFEGEPILAVAAIDELTAAEAIERIRVDYEMLPFVTDPLESLRPGSPNALTTGNVWAPAGGPARRDLEGAVQSQTTVQSIKWTDQDFAEAGEGQLPMGQAPDTWAYGDLDAGFKDAALVVDETFVVQATSHQSMETRTALAYWQNGTLYLHGSTQSTMRTKAEVARWVGVDQANLVFISEYTGGGFGSKGRGAVSMAIPALLAKKANAPVMMRISREDEHYIGHARTNMTGRAKVGFRKDGRILALDLFIVQDNGARGERGDHRAAAGAVSLLYQPVAMRFRAINVVTNTPTRLFQRSPGEMQGVAIVEQAVTKAAKQLGLDQVEMRKINAPAGKAPVGPARPNGQRGYITSAFVKEALDQGAERFGWREKAARSGQRQGTKVRGVGVAVGTHTAGSVGHDGLMTIRPDGKLYVQSGVGNLGTHSLFDLARVAADILEMPWEKVEVIWGSSAKHLPYSCMSVGSQTTHAMTRANHAGAMDAKKKLQEIAAQDLGGAPEDYEIGGERVFRKGNPSRGLSYAQAASRAIELGGRFDGHELPEDINRDTKSAATALAGLGLMGVARDNYPHDGTTYSFVAGFAEVEVDLETGKPTLVDYLGMGDVGTVINPRSMAAQINGGSCLGIGHALCQKWAYDPHYGVPLAKRFHYTKPLTILDIPSVLHAAAVELPDPETPVGARGVGEPPVGAAYGAVMNAIADAIGVDAFRRAPVTPDIILSAIETGKRTHEPLQAHI